METAEQGLSFFFPTPETSSSFISSFLPRPTPVSQPRLLSLPPADYINMQEGKDVCADTHNTHTNTCKQPLPGFILHLGEADFIRDLHLLMAPLTHIGGETQSENAAAIKGNTTEIKK